MADLSTLSCKCAEELGFASGYLPPRRLRLPQALTTTASMLNLRNDRIPSSQSGPADPGCGMAPPHQAAITATAANRKPPCQLDPETMATGIATRRVDRQAPPVCTFRTVSRRNQSKAKALARRAAVIPARGSGDHAEMGG